MGSTLESIISILELLFGMLVYFAIPSLIFLTTFTVTAIVITCIGSSFLTVVFTRLPTVERPLNSLTKRYVNPSEGNFARTRLVVVGCLSVSYAVVYVLTAWGLFAIYKEVGRVIFTRLPEWYLTVTELSYPVVALLFGLPLILALHTQRESWRDSASRFQTAVEWGIALLTLNVLVPIGLYSAVYGSGMLASRLGMFYFEIIYAISRLLQ